MDEPQGKSKAERKKARRRARKAAEVAESKRLETLATEGVDAALRLAPEVAAAAHDSADRALPVAVTTVDAARFVRKRINEALAYEEWHTEVEAWVWDADTSVREALTEHGAEVGVELRLEQVRTVRD
ncbi:MAG: hypothetical protein RIB98_01190 [Acidimicrobiales bacterium]